MGQSLGSSYGDQMKNWLTIGQFAKQASLTEKALRTYEKAGLIQAHARGENQYRYYTTEQLGTIESIRLFKSFGFSLAEIRGLLEIDMTLNSGKLSEFLEKRLDELKARQNQMQMAQIQLQKILSSLKTTKPDFNRDERRFIMSQLDKLSVVVTGACDLKRTAQYISRHLARAGKSLPVLEWSAGQSLPTQRPSILIIGEEDLKTQDLGSLAPDIVVIQEVSRVSEEVRRSYRKLYSEVGPHMSTILNADDRAVVELAGSDFVRQGKTYYFSKNSGLQSQIQRIGGVVSDGEKVEIYGMNQSPEMVEVRIARGLGQSDEMAYLASIAAVMELNLPHEALNLGD